MQFRPYSAFARTRLQRSVSALSTTCSCGCMLVTKTSHACRSYNVFMVRGRLPVMLVGEAGTGTQDLAALIHYSSCRTNIPMVSYACAAPVTGAVP